MGKRRRFRKVSPEERAAFYEHCKKTKESHQNHLDQQNELEQSPELLECQQRQEHEKLLMIKQLPFSIETEELENLLCDLLDQFPSPIVHCKLFRHRYGRYAGKPSGKAQVTCASEAVAQILLNEASTSTGIVVEDRKIQIEEYTGALPTRVKDQDTEPFHFKELQIGYHTKQGYQVKWKQPNVKLELNGRNRRQIGIEYRCPEYEKESSLGIDSTFCRLEFQVRNVLKCLVSPNNEKRRIIMFQFRYAPLIFKARENCLPEEFIWLRSVDTTPNGVLGCCTFYRFVGPKVGSVKDRMFLTRLFKFNFHPRKSNSITRLDERVDQVELKNRKNMNWWSVHSAAFSVLPFPTRYLLHAVLSAHKLWFEEETQMTLLADILQNLTLEEANDVLTTWFYTEEKYTLHQWIQWITEEHGLPVQEQTSEILIRKVLITPTQVCPLPPQPDFTNRIIRQFEHLRDRFIRVRFVDENYGSIFQARSEAIFDLRLRPLLKKGIKVAGHTFVFLAFSNSQLREQSCWMYDESSPSDVAVPTADEIRASMGNLTSIEEVGKYASRMGQGLSSSTQTIRLSEDMVVIHPDVKRNDYTFSDGVGMLSSDLADQVRNMMGLKRTPSAFQIRYKGAKGVVSVIPTSLNLQQKMILRPSMIKFEGHEDQCNLEILSYSKPMKCYLNRQAITILSSLGIKDKVFMNMLDTMLHMLDRCIMETESALNVLDYTMHQKMYTILQCGFVLEKDPYLMSYVVAIRNCLLLGVQNKARIFVPQGLNLIGIMDETESIPPGHVFFQWCEGNEIKRLPPNRKVAVYRSPSLHPGDIQVLTTYDSPKLRDLVDVIVFPSLGDRPHPNELSGGDLDGDIYSVIWDPKLLPAKNYPPMDYCPPDPIGFPFFMPITIEDVQRFFVDYMMNDNVGVIANAHVVFADSKPEGALSEECIKLAELHSTAVDFAKTDEPAFVPDNLRVHTYPDFMENANYTSYKSTKILGKIYRSSKKPNVILNDKYKKVELDAAMEVPGWKEYEKEAREVFIWYGKALWEIMCRFEVYDEGQLLSKQVVNLSRKHSNSKQQEKNIKQHLRKNVSDVQKRFEDEFWSEFDEQVFTFEVLKKASAWYQVAYQKGSFLSFAWVVSEVLCHIKQMQEP